MNAVSLARDLSVSPRYLQKMFAETGERLSVYLRRRRLESAYDTLMHPLHFGETVSEICYQWGFKDSAYFSRAFRMQFGVSPSAHRNTWKQHEKRGPKGLAHPQLVRMKTP